MSENQFLDPCLPALIDNYEGPERNIWITISCAVEEEEQRREALASQVAQGLLLKNAFGDSYRLTHKGYLEHSARSKALKAMRKN